MSGTPKSRLTLSRRSPACGEQRDFKGGRLLKVPSLPRNAPTTPPLVPMAGQDAAPGDAADRLSGRGEQPRAGCRDRQARR